MFSKLIDLLSSIGVEVEKLNKNKFSFKAENVNIEYLQSKEFKKKGSIKRVNNDSRSLAGKIR